MARRKLIAAAVGVVPAAVAVTAVVEQLTGGTPSDAATPWLMIPVSFAVFAVAAVMEEVGWTAYATDDLLTRRSPVVAALGLGLIWAVWAAGTSTTRPNG